MAKKSLKIAVKAPRGLKATDPIVVKAQKAAQAVIDEIGDLEATVKELQAKGIKMSLSELLSRRTGGGKVSSAGSGKRVVLTDAQRKSVVAALKGGATASSVADQFGVSTATVNNIKRDAGLTKKRK